MIRGRESTCKLNLPLWGVGFDRRTPAEPTRGEDPHRVPLLGKWVRITGTSRGDPNGRVGVARSFDYVVRLRGAAARAGELESAMQEMKVRPVNLKSA